MKNILIPIDGSEHSQRAIEKALELAKVFKSDITLLHVRNTLLPYLSFEETRQFMDMITLNSEETLKDAKESISYTDGKLETVSLDGDVATAIIDYIEENDIDLVVMGSQGLNAGKLQGLLLGSVTNKVLHRIKKPILIVR